MADDFLYADFRLKVKRRPVKLVVTKDVLRACYDLLNETDPFRGWNLPDGADVRFYVTRSKTDAAYCKRVWDNPDIFMIGLSSNTHSQLGTLLASMAHEMIHVHEALHLKRPCSHGRLFQRLAQRVCAVHGFDPKAFW